jgi:phosphoribosylanthranilate isomerase
VPVIAAGGLSPSNVASVIEAVQPWGVDVATGVESSPGVKDLSLVTSFVELARKSFMQREE